ncbi:MAG: UDP-N-acetylmuramate--L-alanine ligase [Syntrophales bacterium]|nr:UDP-N-acetylmuramate--L-alanine ligase [Syntrophales bacterium]
MNDMDNDKIIGMRRRVKCIHFVGIGGIGMSGIAEVLLNLGYTISGSDLSASDITQRLSSLGAMILHGHRASHIGNTVDVVVISTAVKNDNPEVLEAHRRNIPVIPRAEMLAELLKMKFSVAVSGSHGKTTTTSMVATVLAHGGLDPTMVIGGKLASIGSNAKMGRGALIVAEADESDGSFLKLSPSLAVITNIDLEHLDHYRDIGEIKEAFLQFANSVPFYGSTILCADDKYVKEILPKIKRKFITYGLDQSSDYRAGDISFSGFSTGFSLYYKGDLLGDVKLNVPGLFNVYNAMAVIAVARELEMEFSKIREGLENFAGVHRRMEIKGKVGEITVIDDYGHHPTEIRETLSATRQVWKEKIIAIFQPHRYTRTKALFHEFLTAFSAADSLIITDIYPAGEEAIEGINAPALCEGIRNCGHGDVIYLPGFDGIVDHLLSTAEPSDIIITLGAGNVWKIGEEFLVKAAAAGSGGAGKWKSG